MRRPSVAALALACGLAAAPPLAAQTWPERPVRLVVPLPPGGQPDVVARMLAQRLGERLRQAVVIESKPGAQTNIAMEAVARAAPDGYTLLFALTSLAINAHLQKLSFDPLRDLAPVSTVARTQFVLVTAPSLEVASVPQLLAHAREHPGKLNCAHAGGVTQMGCALLGSLAQVRIVLVPYRSNTLVHGDLVKGEVQLLFDGLANVVSQARAGRMRPLAVTDATLGSEPLEALPRMSQALPGFELTSWLGVMAPAGTPAAIVQRLNAEIGAALAEPETQRWLAERGVRAMHDSPEGFGEFLRRESARYAAIVRDAGLRE